MGLLGRAKNLMQGWSSPAPSRAQLFHLACSEGHRLQGQRTEGYQALRCPTCGEGIFVLPRSPLPDPPAPAGSPRASVAEASEANSEDGPIPLTDPVPDRAESDREPEAGGPQELADIDWVDEAAAPSPAEEVVEPPAQEKPKPRPRPTAPVRASAEPGPGPMIEAGPPFSIQEWAWRHRNRLLVVGLLILVSSAVGIRRRRQRMEDLPRVAEIGRTTGLKKLDDGDFQAAKKLLADAASAVDSLGGNYQGGESIRQGAREAAIFTDLATEGLDQILESAATFRKPEDWTKHFATFHKGRSVILETSITAVPLPGKPDSPYEVGTYFFAGRATKPLARARIDLAGFRLFELSEPKLGELKTFGARLASLEFDAVTSVWIYTLEPDSGVYMTHPKALDQVFGPSSDGDEGSP